MKHKYGVWYENDVLVGGVIPFPVTPWESRGYWSVKIEWEKRRNERR